MDIKTKYLGMELKSPLVISASPLSEKIENLRKMEDAGAGAIVLHSLFQEQVEAEQKELNHLISSTEFVSAEAMSYFPEPENYRLGPEEYLEHIRKAKNAINIPVIASLNGSSTGGWVDYAEIMQDAGADALELNLYDIPTSFGTSGADIERRYLDVVKAVRSQLRIPLAIKISPYFSNMANMALRFQEAGADSLVMFNRFYQPDINLEAMEVEPKVALSHTGISRLSMRWIAILKGRVNLDFAATGGIHKGTDVIKMLLVGANAVMITSAILKNGIEYLKTIEKEMVDWLTSNEYKSVQQMIGSMSQMKTPNPGAFERAQYMKALINYVY